MTTDNDETTRAVLLNIDDALSTILRKFEPKGSSWVDVPVGDGYLERLKLGVDQLSLCIQTELTRRNAVEPTDLGT